VTGLQRTSRVVLAVVSYDSIRVFDLTSALLRDLNLFYDTVIGGFKLTFFSGLFCMRLHCSINVYFFCIFMTFIDFQFYIQFYYTLLSLTTLLHSLRLTTLIYTYTSSSSFLHCKRFFLTYTYSSGTIAHYCALYLPHFMLWADIFLLDLAVIVSS